MRSKVTMTTFVSNPYVTFDSLAVGDFFKPTQTKYFMKCGVRSAVNLETGKVRRIKKGTYNYLTLLNVHITAEPFHLFKYESL